MSNFLDALFPDNTGFQGFSHALEPPAGYANGGGNDSAFGNGQQNGRGGKLIFRIRQGG